MPPTLVPSGGGPGLSARPKSGKTRPSSASKEQQYSCRNQDSPKARRSFSRNAGGGDFDAMPVSAAVGPGIVEEAALAVGSGQADHPAVGDGEHGADGAV